MIHSVMCEWQTHKRVVRELMKLMDVDWLYPPVHRMLASKMFPCEPENEKSIISEKIEK